MNNISYQHLDNKLNGFCDDPLWDIDLTWYNTWPEFTQCFQSTVLVWIPCGWLWLTAPFYVWYLASSSRIQSGHIFSKLFIFKLGILCALIILTIINLLNVISKKGNTSPDRLLKADVFEQATLLLTLFLAFAYTIAERRKRFVTSGILFIFWLLLLITNIVHFYTYIKLEVYTTDLFVFSTFYIQFFCYIMEFILHFFAEKTHIHFNNINRKPSPENNASFPSRFTFWWMQSIMKQGYKQPLTERVMPDLAPRDKCQTILPRFLNRWTPALEAAQRKSKRKTGVVSLKKQADERSPLLGKASSSTQSLDGEVKKPKVVPSLALILFKTFWAEYFLSQIWKLFYDVLLLCNPLLLGFLVDFVQNTGSEPWQGFLLAVTLFLSMCMQSIFFHQLFHQSTSLGLRIRASIISSVFRKSLTMDNVARKESTVGEVVNLMSVDAGHIESLMSYAWAMWSSPLQIVVSMYLLYNIIGISIFAGAGFLVLLIPANGFITAQLGNLQTQLMAHKDERMKIMNELLSGIKIVKLFAWEKSFERRILEVRDKELQKLRRSAILGCTLSFSWAVAPFLVSLLTFLSYVYLSSDHYLNPKTAFVAISLLNILRYSINFAPMIVTDVIKAFISAKRIEKYLCHDDIDQRNVYHTDQSDHVIHIERGTFRWSSEFGITLKNINMSVDEGKLVAVVGTVGSGKSSLLSALLGEMQKMEGRVSIKGSLAYVSQQAWIQNDTLRNNILFGRPLDQSFYDQCLDACALRPDLNILPAGDLTEIGERGINLSGGQKQRVALARAVYSQSDIYLLDDPLSAVDSHVGQHIFDQVISEAGLLKRKARILVTHGIQFLPRTDHIIVMTGGQISEAGHYKDLMTHNGPFAKLITAYLTQEVDQDNTTSEELKELKEIVLRQISETDNENDDSEGTDIDILRKISSTITQISEKKEILSEEKLKSPKKLQQSQQDTLVEEEMVATGNVRFGVFKEYGNSVGFFYISLIILFYAGYTASDMGSSVYLSIWTDDTNLGNFTKWPSNSTQRMDENNFYIGIYGVFGILQTLFVMGYSLTESFRSIHASRKLHSSMLQCILHAPMSFFDTTPVGRIINRFSKDMDDVDEQIPMTFHYWLDCVFIVLSSVIIISYSTPIFLPFLLPLAVLYFFIQRFFIATSRQLKRLGAKTTSPIFNHFSETLTGASVIRAFGAEKRFVQEADSKVDLNQIFMFITYSCNRWLGVRLEFVGNVVTLAAAIIAVATRDVISGGIMGLSITYALQVTENLNWLVRMTSDLETQIVSVERIIQYTELDTEAAWENFMYKSPVGWPTTGHVKIENLSLRYRDGLDLVLKSVSFEVNAQEKVGIVGRTGAGKSSLTQALFRLVEPAGGKIIIDKMDISQLGLHDLRSKITILPQDPVIFEGTLRTNLDPFSEFGEDALWVALEHAHLKSFVESLPDKLDHQCGEGGENLSVGQRQLLCLGRALLRKTKILILDEATAAVDMETDELIQTTIRQEFHDCTILTIAHRLNTVMDYDRILVLDKGEVREYDTPQNLLKNTDGIFYSMAKTAGLVS
ncbi:multidrug resistance-associated protein 1-like [Physella acuta]|uniref:multidrug resistance-associated protein 1-like n=1 Tax=Physella acuta TaxID=109671 RepID=UPI0027DC0E1E|nr:multidrug resistance-associated protein 1-like [Physella acuta]